MQYIALIGREKHLAYAELESVFGDIQKLGQDAVMLDTQHDIDLTQLGSVIKIAQILNQSISLESLPSEIITNLTQHFQSTQVGSIDFGISVYDKSFSEKAYSRLLINSKKQLKNQGIKCRFVTTKNMQLNAAQVKHNGLIKNGVEFIIIQDQGKYLLAKTTQIQDIDKYSERDFGRPNRNMKVGMFPPKLAQIMINLAQPSLTTTVFDPFCGSGVVLQESLLRHLSAWGSDNSENEIQASKQNIEWLINKYNLAASHHLFLADATKLTQSPDTHYCIVSEGYLGEMLSIAPSSTQIASLEQELARLYLQFLTAITHLQNSPQSVVITLPCWQTKDSLIMLKIVDQIINLGYTIKQFNSVDTNQLIYRRPSQVVGRQIIVCHLKK